MGKIFLITILLFLPLFAFSQTADQIQKEAYPEYSQSVDNSDFAILLHNLTEAKKSGDQVQFNFYLNELKMKYSDNGNVRTGVQLPESRNYFLPTMTQPEESGNLPDWANGENAIFYGSVSPASTGNPNLFNRLVKIETDTMGVLYTGFINVSKDTLYFYKSTDVGAHWTKIQSIFSGAGSIYYSFDFALADTTGGFKIGMVVSISPSATPYAGTVYYADMLSNGTGFSPAAVFTPTSGRGIIGPVICTDAYSWSPGSTYWYIAAQNCDASTGVTSFVPCAYTPDWGSTWVHDTARSTYNDYELDIDYNFDSVYVLLTNNLTITNSNLRLRYTALGTWGTNVSWKQFNPAGESFPEYNACLAVNRKTNAMVVTYTTDESSNNNIKYSYAANGYTWVVQNMLSGQTNNETRSYISGSNQQSGAFRVVFCSESSGHDSVIYMNTSDITTGFSNRTLVSRANLSTGVLSPCVTGYMFNAVSSGAGVVYAGYGPANIWFNGSSLVTETTPISSNVPEKYSLSQNYPNPFNPVTKIYFALPKNGFVSMKVFDMLGREVDNLINEFKTAGSYSVNFNGNNLTSGIYFYKYEVNGFTETKKMMLIK